MAWEFENEEIGFIDPPTNPVDFLSEQEISKIIEQQESVSYEVS